MRAVADFHTHILPELDDGSVSVEMSLDMLREELSQGINKIVLTPHFYANHDSPERFLKRRNKSFEKLKAEVGELDLVPELLLGAEVRYFDGISDCDYLSDFVVEGTNLLLVELPSRDWDERMLFELGSIYPKRGIVPVVAHVDRYVTRFHSDKVFGRLAELRVKIQCNANFFLRISSRGLALRMLAEGKIHFLGSDCHDLNERKPNLGVALKIIEHRLGGSVIENIKENEKVSEI